MFRDPTTRLHRAAFTSVGIVANVAFDDVSDASGRNAVADRIRETFSGAPRASDAVLIDASGSLMEAAFARHLAARDDHPSALNE